MKSVCSGSKRSQLQEPHTDSVRIHSLSKWSSFFSLGNRMIYVPTAMPLDCLKQGEEMQSEHEGHVWMISQPQLPAATSGRQQSPGILEEQKEQLVQNR